MYICIYCRFPIRDHLEALLCDDRQQAEYRAAVRSAATSQLYTSQEKLSHRCKKPQSSSRSEAARSLVRRMVRDQWSVCSQANP